MPQTKLTAAKAREIAEAIASGERQTDIARRFGVAAQTVGAIKSGKRWANAIDDDLWAHMAAAPAIGALDVDAARQVLAALDAGRSGRLIAEEFGISASMVSAIKHGRAWAAAAPELAQRIAEKPAQGKALSAMRVARIKRLLVEGVSSRQVAAQFGVSASTVLSIARGKTWAHVAPQAASEDAAEGFAD